MIALNTYLMQTLNFFFMEYHKTRDNVTKKSGIVMHQSLFLFSKPLQRTKTTYLMLAQMYNPLISRDFFCRITLL